MTTVRKIRDADESRQRVWNAAAQAFATHGFEGAKVDTIAAEAGVNKAMLYYHFADKLALYRDILRDMFAAVARVVAEVRAAGGTPEVQLRGYVSALARAGEERPHFPAIWLREIADDGRHLDASIFAELHAVLRNLGAILEYGTKTRKWRVVDPFLVQAGIAAPLMLVFASRKVRARSGIGLPDAPTETLIDHVTTMTLATLKATARRPS